MSEMESEVDFSKTFRILIASDIHLGYNEKHHERGIHTKCFITFLEFNLNFI